MDSNETIKRCRCTKWSNFSASLGCRGSYPVTLCGFCMPNWESMQKENSSICFNEMRKDRLEISRRPHRPNYGHTFLKSRFLVIPYWTCIFVDGTGGWRERLLPNILMFVISLGTSAKVWLGKLFYCCQASSLFPQIYKATWDRPKLWRTHCYKKFSASDGIESINKNWKAGPILTSNTALDGAERILVKYARQPSFHQEMVFGTETSFGCVGINND